jgi:hypothetical protein
MTARIPIRHEINSRSLDHDPVARAQPSEDALHPIMDEDRTADPIFRSWRHAHDAHGARCRSQISSIGGLFMAHIGSNRARAANDRARL